jgi:hypothetical protein
MDKIMKNIDDGIKAGKTNAGVKSKLNDLLCIDPHIELIEQLKTEFINTLIGQNVRYIVIGHISAHMNEAINEIKAANE